ncbi:MAG: AbrB/MazE/SpoVT family DNA-binding domain-containing protein [Candidatus Rifleibacteriota bacterium]
MASLKTNLIKIGNSQGIRIPKTIIKQCGLREEVILEVCDGQLVVRSADEPRKNWENAFKSSSGENLKFAEISNEWDETEWEW